MVSLTEFTFKSESFQALQLTMTDIINSLPRRTFKVAHDRDVSMLLRAEQRAVHWLCQFVPVVLLQSKCTPSRRSIQLKEDDQPRRGCSSPLPSPKVLDVIPVVVVFRPRLDLSLYFLRQNLILYSN